MIQVQLKIGTFMHTVLITGGLTGIGKALVDTFASAGHQVIACSRRIKANHFHHCIYEHHLDVLEPHSVEQLFKDLDQENLHIDILINNAGIGIYKPFLELSLAEWDLLMNTNLRGNFLCSQAAIAHMINDGGGRIINIGSIIEKYPRPLNSLYAASKAAITNLSSQLNEEFKHQHIRISNILLGATNTAIWQERDFVDKNHMLDVKWVAAEIYRIAVLPIDIRVDAIEILPARGIL